MRNIVKRLVLVMLLCSFLMVLCSCDETNISVVKNTYSPDLILSGDIEELSRIRLVDDNSSDLKLDAVELNDIVSRVNVIGELDGLMILTHGNKAVYINNASIPKYYFAVNSSGVIRLFSRLETLSDMADLPLDSVSEIVFCSKNPTDKCIKRVYKEQNERISHKLLFRAYGLFIRASNAVENEKYSITTFNKSAVKVSVFLNGEKSGKIKFNDDRSIAIDSNSTYTAYWNNGGLYLAEKEYKLNNIVEIIIDN